MKHFLPSMIMLTPFLVRYYDEEDENEVVETNQSLKEKEQQTEIIE